MTITAGPGTTIRLEITRRFAASPERVFDAWLDPATVGRWLFATPGGVMRRVEIDPRVGGRFRVDEQRGEALARHAGEYLEIDRPRRLVFRFATGGEAAPTIVTIAVVPAEGGCVLTLTHAIDAAWADHADRTRNGWTKILEGLSETLGGDSLTLTRLFDAPPALVFKAWTGPEHVARWWGPKDFTVPSCEWDFRPGGRWRACMRSAEGAEYRSRGVFREIAAPERLVFTFAWEEPDALETLVTVTLSEQDGKTRLTFHQTPFKSRRQRDSHLEGWGECMDRLADHLASAAA